MKSRRRKWIWIGLGALAMLVRWLVGQDSAFIERFYARGLFLGIRKILDYTIGLLPFPVLYLLLGAVLFYGIRGIARLFKRQTAWQDALLSIGAFLGGGVFLFLFLWGYNYARIPLEQQLNLEVEPLELEDIEAALRVQYNVLAQARNDFRSDTLAATKADLPKNLKPLMQAELQKLLGELGYPNNFKVKSQRLRPKGVLLRFSTLGVYFPWTGECNVDAGLHPLEQPFVFAHELAHGYGITDEGTCNFLAYLTCIRSENAMVRYAGHLEYFSTLAYNYRRYKPEEFRKLLTSLPKNIKADWNAMVNNHRLYPDIMPKLRNATYDAYLRAQGIDEGIQNYNRVLMLVKAWKEP